MCDMSHCLLHGRYHYLVRHNRGPYPRCTAAKLYVNENKTKLFQTELKFLGHKISARGIEADDTEKVDTILAWPVPKIATPTRAFIDLVRYLSAFPPGLATHTGAP